MSVGWFRALLPGIHGDQELCRLRRWVQGWRAGGSRAAGERSSSPTGDHRVLGTRRGVERGPMARGAGSQAAHAPPLLLRMPSLAARASSCVPEPGLPLSSHLHERRLVIRGFAWCGLCLLFPLCKHSNWQMLKKPQIQTLGNKHLTKSILKTLLKCKSFQCE